MQCHINMASDQGWVLFLFLTKEAYSYGGLHKRKLGQTYLSVNQPWSEHWI